VQVPIAPQEWEISMPFFKATSKTLSEALISQGFLVGRK
jgi:hypothetical protein